MCDNGAKKDQTLDFSDSEDVVVLSKSDAEQSDDEQTGTQAPEAETPEPSACEDGQEDQVQDTEQQNDADTDNTDETPDSSNEDSDQASATTVPSAPDSNEEDTQGEDNITATEDEVSEPSIDLEKTYEYTIPEWFLAHNVRTSKELSSGNFKPPCRLVLTGDETEKKSSSEDKNLTLEATENGDSEKAPIEETEDTPVKKPSLPEFQLSHKNFTTLRDLTAAALVPDKNGKLSTSCLGPVVRGLTDDEIPFLSGFLQLVAKDLNASLVTLTWEDLEELGREFERQDQAKAAVAEPTDACDSEAHDEPCDHPPSNTSKCEDEPDLIDQETPKTMHELAAHYFSCRPRKNADSDDWSRVKTAIDAVIDSHLVKSSENSRADEEEDNEEDPILIVHVQAANRIATLDGELEEYRTLCRFADNIIARRRHHHSASSKVVFVGSIIKDPAVYVYDTDVDIWQSKLADYMDVGKDRSVLLFGEGDLTPLYVPTVTDKDGGEFASPETIDKTTAFSKRAKNLLVLKRSLRQKISHLFGEEMREMFMEPSVEDPGKGWFDLDGEEEEMWGKNYWTQEEVDKAVVQIQGRALGKEFVEMEDIKTVLRRLDMISVGDDAGKEEDDDNKAETWAEKIERIRGEANDVELDLIGNVVDPESINVTFDDVIMDPSTKEHLQTLISLSTTSSSPSSFTPLATSSFLQSQLRLSSTLLYGPPGTGKTHLARAIASSFPGSSFLAVDSAVLQGKYVGETEKAIKAAFSLARKLTPCVLFMDEVDALFYKRKSDDVSWQRSALAQFLMEMDGINADAATNNNKNKKEVQGQGQSQQQPFVVVASNRPQDLDEAFYRRLPCKVYFGLPGKEARAQIIKGLIGGDLDDEEAGGDEENKIMGLAMRTEGYSGSDLKNLCGEAALIWAVEMVKERGEMMKEAEKEEKNKKGADGKKKAEREEIKVMLGAKHFAKALTKIRPSVSPVEDQGMKQFMKRFNPGACKN